MKILFLIAPLILFLMSIQSQAHELGECNTWACQTLDNFYMLPPEEQEKQKRTVLNGSACLSYLQDAVILEMEMLELHPHHHLDVSRDARLAMVKKMNAKSAERIVAMKNYQECLYIAEGYDRYITPDDHTDQGDPIEHAVKAELLGANKGLKRRVRGWAENLDRALGKIPGLFAIDSFFEDASDFDMTKEGTGHKVAFEMVAATLGEAGLSYLVKGLPWVKAAKAAGAVDDIGEGAGNIGKRSGGLLEEVGLPPKLIDDWKPSMLKPIDHPPPPTFPSRRKQLWSSSTFEECTSHTAQTNCRCTTSSYEHRRRNHNRTGLEGTTTLWSQTDSGH
jgi:hypothetical protein